MFASLSSLHKTVNYKSRDATTDAILKRYSSINYQHPTYAEGLQRDVTAKALLELGKAEKTIFLCNYLPSPEVKGEVHAGLNVVENWNGANDFIFYGRKGKFETNNPEEMEISMLCAVLSVKPKPSASPSTPKLSYLNQYDSP